MYRAYDPRLGRDVAIKVFAQQASDRFEREARVVAALNHPHICHSYDVGPNYQVLEFIERQHRATERTERGCGLWMALPRAGDRDAPELFDELRRKMPVGS